MHMLLECARYAYANVMLPAVVCLDLCLVFREADLISPGVAARSTA